MLVPAIISNRADCFVSAVVACIIISASSTKFVAFIQCSSGSTAECIDRNTLYNLRENELQDSSLIPLMC